MKIEDKEINIEDNYLDKVTYVPKHANGNASHPDCDQGVIVDIKNDLVFVLYCNGRTVQATEPKDLVWVDMTVNNVDSNKDDFIGEIDKFRRQSEAMIEYVKIVAKIRKAAYDVYIEEGFDSAEALELAKEDLFNGFA